MIAIENFLFKVSFCCAQLFKQNLIKIVRNKGGKYPV